MPDFTGGAVEAVALDFRIQEDLEFVDEDDELDNDELDDELVDVGRS